MRLAEIPIKKINFGERFRKDYGNIEELILSFKKEGIIQPLAIYQTSDDSYLLLAGGRRFTAAKQAGLTSVPARIYDSELTDDEMRSIELMENVCRKDLSWDEKVKLEAEIHELQIRRLGKKAPGPGGNGGWGVKDTADLLGVTTGKVSQDLQLAAMLDKMPSLKDKCKNADEARKLVNNLVKKVQVEEVAKKLTETREKTPLDIQRTELVNRFIIQDCLVGMKSIPNSTVDIVEIDPPYGIDLSDMKKSEDGQNLQMDGYNEVESGRYLAFMDRVLAECYRVMTNESWLILWFGPDPWFDPLFQLLRKHNFEGKRMPGLWVKENHTGQAKRPDVYLPNCYEMFFYARKGNASIAKPGRPNIFSFSPIPAQRKTHPTERPVEMIQEVLSTFSQSGKRGLVPFLGSGNTLLAMENLGIKGVGFELNESYKNSFTLKVFEGKAGSHVSYR